MVASCLGFVVVAKNLIVDSEIDEQVGGNDYTAVLYAVWNNHKTVVELLLDNGSCIETNYSGRTLLATAVKEQRDVSIVKLLLDRNADIETKDYKNRKLLSQVGNHHLGTEITEMLIEYGADLEARHDHGMTPLMNAVYYGNSQITEALIKRGANLEARDDYGRTPLMVVENDHKAIVKILLENGANIEAKDNDGMTPLWRMMFPFPVDEDEDDEAMEYSSYRMARIQQLLRYGADTEVTSYEGRTALHEAVRRRDRQGRSCCLITEPRPTRHLTLAKRHLPLLFGWAQEILSSYYSRMELIQTQKLVLVSRC